MKTIEQILEEVAEDKKDNLSTTSFKFKTDLWEFFSHDRFKKMACVEFGTHKGQTTRVLSYLFEKVYTFNLPNHFDEAKRLNSDRDNITYIGMNLYSNAKTPTHSPISVFFIDAIHTFDALMMDFSRAIEMKLDDGDVYFVFDDYGLSRDVFQAVNQLILTRSLERVQYIGHGPRHSFGGVPERVLTDHEGIICKLINR